MNAIFHPVILSGALLAMIPIALLRWEFLSLKDEIELMDQTRNKGAKK